MLHLRSIKQTPNIKPVPLIISTLLTAVLALSGCQTQSTRQSRADAAAPVTGNPDKFLIVDCLLPGQVRKLGANMTYLSPRRPVKTTASECEIRGGEYVAFDRADYRTSLRVWLPQAQEGDPVAQNYVGEIYEKGLGIEPDYATAAAWYLKAADQGNSRARINLGFLHEKGFGVKKDLAQALNWYRKASGLEDDNLQFSSAVEISKAERKELRLLQQERQQQKSETERLRKQLKNTSTQLKSERVKLTKAEKRLKKLRSEAGIQPAMTTSPLITAASDVKQLKSELAVSEKQAQQQRTQIAVLEKALTKQRTQMDSELKQSQLETEQQRKQAAILRRKLDETNQQLINEKASLTSTEAELAMLRSELSRKEKLSKVSQDEALSALQAQLTEQEKAVVAQQRKIVDLESSLSTQQTEMNEALRLSTQEKAQLEEALKVQTGKASQLKEKLDRTQIELDRAIADIEKNQPVLSDQRRQLELAQKTLNETTSKSITLEQTVVRLQQDLEKRESTMGQQGQAVAKLREQLTKYQQRLQVLEQEKINQQTALQGDVAKQERQIAELRQKLEETERQLDADQAQLAKVNPDLARQQSLLRKTQKELVATKTAAARKEAEVIRLRKSEQDFLDQIQQQQIKIDRYQAEALRYRAQLADLRANEQASLVSGPTIEIIDPPVALTRGIPSVRLRSAAKERQITGRVVAPAGLLSFTVNDKTESPDKLGIFSTNVRVEDEQTPVKMVAVDKKGQHTSLEFLLIPKLRYASSAEEQLNTSSDSRSTTRRIAGQVDFGNYHALIIGNNQYNDFPNLLSASVDARETAELLRTKYGFQTTTLIDATRYDMLSALNQLRETLTENDNLLIYYAGHGELDRVNLRGYWLPVDAEPNSTTNWISNIAITDILNAMSAKHILVVADSCYSGSLTRSSMARLESGMSDEVKTKWLRVMAKTRSRTVLTSGGLKPVLDQGGGQHSVFAKSFLRTLAENDSILEAYKLFRNLAKEVQQTASRFGIDQIPEYAPIKHGGHEAGEFFFIPQG
ncbi:MAG: caspase family protein [Candidatus Thiodiazotropha endolucinida]|uniref:Caspase family protein n=1 Tax=Candidatus Thiodiazotropha taylori TaxID=2792791 RepID=A0A9E4TSE3_9GAMM|nr:caspase family protein [Candidatus Thiodiazotropha taylori]MCW4234947.1 caspase family protein [Candidatus Thiodiazotropha endolucinida]